MGGFGQLAAQFDRENTKRKGDQFELVCKWFLENDPAYRPLLRRVWLWKDWPGRWDIDAGIDLVAEDHDGKTWAIQAKAYDPSRTITKKDVDTFVSESSRGVICHRLLIATTDKRHRLATRLMDDLGIPFLGLTQLRDADDYLDWPAMLASLRPAKPLKSKKPWPYQQAAIEDVVKGFKTADRGQLIMACGTGKTLTAWFIREKLAAERTLVLVPSLSLLKQTMREWQLANPKEPFAALPVCSDETVGSLGEDAAVAHISDLGVPVTTDPVKIAEFLRKRSGPRVVFSTYQSSPQIASAFTEGRVPLFDLVIADEAHRVAGPVSSDFATVLDPSAIKAKRRLFMTATPRYFTGRVVREAKQADYEVASMDDHARFGEVLHRLTFSQAIEDNLLTDYRVAIIGVDDATYRDWAERGTLVTLGGAKNTDARSLAGQIGLAKAMKMFDLHRLISFHSRVKAAKDFSASMPAVLDWMPPRQRPKGKLWSDFASGDMSAGDRHVLLQHLKRLDDGERGLLANARCLSEGVDVPALDGVAFIDPRRSEVDIVQAVGRAIRKSDNKTVGTIVIPVFIDSNEDAEVALDSSVFKPVWDVVKALRAHDTELGEQLDALRREMGRRGGNPKLPGKIRFDVPSSVGRDFADALKVRLVDATTAPWEFLFGLLERYSDEFGHSAVPQRYKTQDGYPLGSWVNTQRNFYARGQLSSERQGNLEALPRWVWDVRDATWDEGFRNMELYIEWHGNCQCGIKYRTPDGYPLGTWAAVQRRAYSQGSLRADRKSRLEALHAWTWDALSDYWEDGYRHLSDYQGRYGDCNVPINFKTEGGFPLGSWVNRQRTKYGKGKLSTDRSQRIESLSGWTWDARDGSWESAFELLLAYNAKNGSPNVPQLFRTSDGTRLGGWVSKQRSDYRRGALSEQRAERLAALPGWTWDPFADGWEEGFRHLLTYVKRTGSARPWAKFQQDGYPLGHWVSSQRAKGRQGTLDADCIQRLEALSGWTWDPRSEAWDQGFEELVEYTEATGTARVPAKLRHGDYPLGQWAVSQRDSYRLGTLSRERIEKLEALPEWTWNLGSEDKQENWEEAFRRLGDYAQRTGTAMVPPRFRDGDFRLGGWVSKQRDRFKSGSMPEDQVKRLEALPGWTWRPREERWELMFGLVQEYVNEHGSCVVPVDHFVYGLGVGLWMKNQRKRFTSLTEDRQRKLESLPGWS